MSAATCVQSVENSRVLKFFCLVKWKQEHVVRKQ